MFFNYSEIYEALVIIGACSAFFVLIGLVVYLKVEYSASHPSKKNKILKITALINTVAIGLFEVSFQVMANNLINLVQGILSN